MAIVDYEDIETDLHRRVDGRLGDRIFVRIPPADWPVDPIKGFVVFLGEAVRGGGLNFDPIKAKPQLKIRKELLPAEPDRTWRFRSAKLGAGVFQIAADVQDGSAHWLFDVQLTSDA